MANTDTREQLLDAARRHFADRGFYGASIAAIAEELGLTKQALLHHFGNKEKLYGEVLQRISREMSATIASDGDKPAAPARRFERSLLSLYETSIRDPDTTQLLMRELLDNKRRADEAGSWYLKPFLDELVAIVKSIPGRRLSDEQALAIVYQAVGAVSYFAISTPTLTRMYGKAGYGRLRQQFPAALRRQVRALLS